MNVNNIEIKATCNNFDRVRTELKSLNASFTGIDEQTDTYFNISSGRLKIREGKIENALIYYVRDDQASPKLSRVKLYKSAQLKKLKEVLATALGVKAVVTKTREIYFYKNVKIHLDQVPELGLFIEIEAQDNTQLLPKSQLKTQCELLMRILRIKRNQLVQYSYADMLEV